MDVWRFLADHQSSDHFQNETVMLSLSVSFYSTQSAFKTKCILTEKKVVLIKILTRFKSQINHDTILGIVYSNFKH